MGEDTDPYAIQKEDLPQIFAEYDKLARIMVDREKNGRGFNFFHFMIDLEGGPCVSKRLSGCGSGTEYLAVTPWGDLYPCHQFVGQEEFLMGNVDEGITRPDIADAFRGCSVYSKESCRKCFARFYCSGGCMANSYKFQHTINDTYEAVSYTHLDVYKRQHNITAMALGVFILWFCWFGFNGGSTTAMSADADMELASLVMFNTNLAAAVAAVVALIFTWLRYGKPDVSMTFNAVLAGLVAVTAPCDCVTPTGAFFIGLVAGVLVVLSVEFFDNVAKIDDPVGAISVHMVNGIWGTLAVGLFSNGGDGVGKGLFYGGGFKQLGVQALGVVTVGAYVLIVMFIVFKVIDKTVGLRVPADIEIDGLDIHEHGLASAYSGFAINDMTGMDMDVNENTCLLYTSRCV